jgi:hypothetical protein
VAFLMAFRRVSARIRPGALALFCAAMGAHAWADAGWLEAGDPLLRADLQLLNDAEVIRYPLNQWPIPRAGLRYALANAREHFAVNAAVLAAFERVKARANAGGTTLHATVRGGQAGLLRDFDTIAREDGELGAGVDWQGDRLAAGLNVTVVADPRDGQQVRADGSHLTARLGNWLVSAQTLERWWGPGHESSLIVSNNARPMPTLLAERAEARPFESDWLSWLGPWRFSFAVSQMESDRADIDSPLFMAWRVAVMPFKDIELGFSRTAQFCGKQLTCDLDTFGNMLAGNDNVGVDATPENEPGNQMAGFDIHWASPIGSWPYAVYSQYIGEDESSYLPAKYLGMLGVEGWKPVTGRGVLKWFAEYANTTCSGLSSRGPYYDCSYNQGRFNVEGYRYRGRVIGHSTDSDAESYALGATFAADNGSWWSLTARTARLNYDGVDPRNTVSAGPARYAAMELGWRGRLLGGTMSVEIGAESLQPEASERDVEPFGFVGWRHEFRP